MPGYRGKVAVVTGAASGIGYAVAARAAAEGMTVVGVNLWGVVHCMQAFLPGMVERDSGHIVNTSSIDGLVTVRTAAG